MSRTIVNIAVVDDEAQFQAMYKTYITRYSTEEKTTIRLVTFISGDDFLEQFHNQFDLVLLDVVMPNKSGFDVAHEIRMTDSRVAIVFITSMAQYAIRGYEVDALDYIVKPLEYDRFAAKFSRILSKITTNDTYTISTSTGVTNINLSDVCYIESDKHYAIWHTAQGDIRTRHTVRALAQELQDGNFVLIRSSVLVNIPYVVRATHDTVWVRSPQGDPHRDVSLPIARAYQASFKMRMTQLITQGGF